MEETTNMPRRINITIFKAHGLISTIHFTKTKYSPKRVNIHVHASSLLQQEIPRNNAPIFKIRPKDCSLWFDRKEVERFIKKVENIVEIEGESGKDIARQISFWTKD
ncbi:hypothetical protein O181_065601 [Austropuccinia psidii MF-1]|uniref:Uncharacterized protein n=1 Tax=Austropuccinia psidii MF-1 TaxID=1389203 RepID=A0A9Q3EPA2_9BASI|nr:hypothetical protein [Austropuccinia psidii MF-1]